MLCYVQRYEILCVWIHDIFVQQGRMMEEASEVSLLGSGDMHKNRGGTFNGMC